MTMLIIMKIIMMIMMIIMKEYGNYAQKCKEDGGLFKCCIYA